MCPVPYDQYISYGGGQTTASSETRTSPRALRASSLNPRVGPYTRFGVDPIVPLKDAAAIAGCHPDTLKNEARRGKLALLRISQRRIGVRESEFNRYLDSRAWVAA
ncbi:MAG: hypothetical protein WBX25_29105 [Rhodomicrobium sp.]